MNARRGALCLVLILGMSAGCAFKSSDMRKVDPARAATSAATGDKAVVVFMRPSRLGGAIQSSVFDVTQPANQTDKLVGIVSSGTKVAYVTEPGEHLFMVVGENADFMTATLAGGKTYYVLVSPRMGWWKARFSLEPVHEAELGSSEFKEWNGTELVENTAASTAWAKENWESIQDKKVDYLQTWNGKTPAERAEQNLLVTDGR